VGQFVHSGAFVYADQAIDVDRLRYVDERQRYDIALDERYAVAVLNGNFCAAGAIPSSG
jgi:hypothetical protein